MCRLGIVWCHWVSCGVLGCPGTARLTVYFPSNYKTIVPLISGSHMSMKHEKLLFDFLILAGFSFGKFSEIQDSVIACQLLSS